MSLLHNQTSANKESYFFLLANASTLNVGNLNANNISTQNINAASGSFSTLNVEQLSISTLVAEYLSSTVLSVSSIVSDGKIDANVFSSIFTYAFEGTVSTLFTEHIILDQATLDVVGGNVLLLNGIPLATTSTSISSLEEWSYYPALSTLNMATNNLANVGNITSQNIFNALNIQSDTIAALTSITSPAATITNLRATNISTTNLNACNVVAPSVRGGAGVFSTLNTSSLVGNSLGVNVGQISSLSVSTLNGIPPAALNASNWATFPATANVNMNGFDIGSGTQPVFQIAASNSLLETATVQMCNVVDRGIDVGGNARIFMNAKNGFQGQIELQADPGTAGVFGRVDITANGGTTGGIGTGGLITLNANTPLGFSNATSAIKMNAAGINSYAGIVPSVGSLAGYNFIYGTNGVNICTGIPSFFPNIPTTTYLYGLGGIVLNSDVYTSAIYPYWDGVSASNGDLLISGRVLNLTNKVYVNLSNVRNISMDFFATIQNVKQITFCNTYASNYISNANVIQGTGTVSGYNLMSATNGQFTTLSNTNVVGSGAGSISGYGTISATNGSFPTLSNTNLIGAGTGQITGYSNITGSSNGRISGFLDVSTATLHLSTINDFTSFGSKSIRVQGDVAQIQLSNTAPAGPGSILNLLSRSTLTEIQSFNSNFTTPLNLLLTASTIVQSTNNTVMQGVRQPFIQYSTVATSGGSGSFQVQLPVFYANSNYACHATMNDTTPAQMASQVESVSSFSVYWSNGGGGTHAICWTTYGDV